MAPAVTTTARVRTQRAPTRKLRPRARAGPSPPRDITGRWSAAVRRIFNNPLTVVVFAITLVLALTHTGNPAESAVSFVGTKLNATTRGQAIGKFILDNKSAVTGSAVLSGAVMMSAAPRERLPYIAGACLFAFLVPEWSSWSFAWMAAMLFLYLQLRKFEDRVILVIISITAWIWLGLESPSP